MAELRDWQHLPVAGAVLPGRWLGAPAWWPIRCAAACGPTGGLVPAVADRLRGQPAGSHVPRLDPADVELVGIVDLDLDAARAGAEHHGDASLPLSTDLGALIADLSPDAVVDVTVPVAHHPVTTQSLFAGLPVLGEKPVALDVAEGLSLAAAAEVTGELFMVSQSRRYDDHLVALGTDAR